ncbi:cytochrome c oxidase subunit II [Flavisolibacter tropicus]|uniref:cytochrome c oxidase subunit II n=1 Tax=Flavisolibacter tropicus TaxID=1492898 RepID=UPI0009EEFFF5|nr:cytochrome c oxidase subunit II [Flavisolibacter tropicus]
MSVIDKSEKKVLMITGATLALFIFSILYARGKYNDAPECLPFDKTYETPKVNKLDDKTYQVYAVAQMWQFQPSQIYIPVGAEVDFFLTSKDVVHGFNIAEKNVNMMAVYGNINKTTVKFDKPGVYKITCHEYCGVGHQNMQAEVIVNDPAATK